MGAGLTRRGFLRIAGAGAAWVALGGVSGCGSAESSGQSTYSTTTESTQLEQRTSRDPGRPEGVRAFRSRPDLSPPAVEVRTPARETAPGYVFVTTRKGVGQSGPMIVDDRGRLVWFRPLPEGGGDAMDFRAQRYQGEPVLTWWQGEVDQGVGDGECIILDSSYQEIGRVRAGNGYRGDLHEFLLTPQGTALMTIYAPVRTEERMVLDGIVQEIDMATGGVIFEWHSLDHVGLDESYGEPPDDPEEPFDYFHINSVGVDYDGGLIISARLTFGVYKLDRQTGEVIWRLGGKQSDFEMGEGTVSRYQHDARRQPDGTITLFDNGDSDRDDQSYGLVIDLDTDGMSATLVREYAHPDRIFADTQGNVQVLENGNVFIGWGSEPVFSEFSGDGGLLFSAELPPEVESYRAFRLPWSGRPDEDPAVVTGPGAAGDEVTIYASWNGATEVAAWQALSGPAPDRLEPEGEPVPWQDFETAIPLRTAERYVGLQARDRSGRPLGKVTAIEPGS